jgi:hypothetical protein
MTTKGIYKESENILDFDETEWTWKEPTIANTVQMFITNRCNKRCSGCFYKDRLGSNDMNVAEYVSLLDPYVESADKVILLGGEPTLHPNLLDMIDHNKQKGLRTTVYTNGANLRQFVGFDMTNVTIRLGVDGLVGTEKPLKEIDLVDVPIHLNYMLGPKGFFHIYDVANYASDHFNCDVFFISRYRDTKENIRNYWDGTPGETIPSCYYAALCQQFIYHYNGPIKEIQFLRGGTFKGRQNFSDHCRFINIFPDQDSIICPLDICRHETTKDFYEFGSRPCKNFRECLLQKLILERKSV